MKRLPACFFLLILVLSPAAAQLTDGYPRDTRVDALHYHFTIHLEDTTDHIAGLARLMMKMDPGVDSVWLDLTSLNEEGKGMQVNRVLLNEQPATWAHRAGRLGVGIREGSRKGDTILLDISYSGIPKDGLIISRNRHGERTFFADNWPDRARNWIPCIDHPSDKATVEFTVRAPENYLVGSNGLLTAEYPLVNETNTHPSDRTGPRYRITRWEERIPIPTKVMVIGVADFAWETAGYSHGIAVQSWVYAADRVHGFLDYAPAVGILDYFQELIGPYSYEKLANVQSKTMFGGMENSGCIFYHENSVSGRNRLHSLLAHEIAHQWFGDAVTEGDWHHVWLSEGFATYLEACYADAFIPDRSLQAHMGSLRTSVVNYYKRTGKPVIDTTETNLMRLLNTNSYQKGAWVLHMLRQEVGEELFWNGIRRYYDTYRDKNALTSDFRQVMEETTGLDLSTFFQQWLEREGQPAIELNWTYRAGPKELEIKIEQSQELIFDFPLELGLQTGQGLEVVGPFRMGSRSQIIVFPLESKPLEVILDPRVKLLFETD